MNNYRLPFIVKIMRRLLGVNALLKNQADDFEALRNRLDNLNAEAERLRLSVTQIARNSYHRSPLDKAAAPLDLSSSMAELPEDVVTLLNRDYPQCKWTVATFPVQDTQQNLASRLIAPVLASRSSMSANTPLVLLIPAHLAEACSKEELEQIFGILGAYQTSITSETGQTALLGKTRTELAGLLLRWTPDAIERIKANDKPNLTRWDHHICLTKAIHGIELTDHTPLDQWEANVRNLIDAIAEETNRATFGFVYRTNALNDPDHLIKAASILRKLVYQKGFFICAQWCVGTVAVHMSSDICLLSNKNNFELDFTPVSRGDVITDLHAYDDTIPYRPMNFDLRIPTFDHNVDAPIIIPRHNGMFRIINHNTVGRKEDSFIERTYDRAAEQLATRLSIVLDRDMRNRYLEKTNKNGYDMSHWPFFSVYNWATTPSIKIHALEFDAEDIFVSRSALSDAINYGYLNLSDARLADGSTLLSAAQTATERQTHELTSILDDQVRQHHYLSAREITPDTRELIRWLPVKLGDTLEIGSGYGVLSREISHRSSIFVGCDLTVSQAISLYDNGGLGFVSDIHELPFNDNEFDTILGDNIVEHSYNPVKCLREIHRVMKVGGRAFLIIPMDYLSNDYQNRAHLWKADERSVRAALAAADLRVARAEILLLSELGVPGAFPSCQGRSSLWEVIRD